MLPRVGLAGYVGGLPLTSITAFRSLGLGIGFFVYTLKIFFREKKEKAFVPVPALPLLPSSPGQEAEGGSGAQGETLILCHSQSLGPPELWGWDLANPSPAGRSETHPHPQPSGSSTVPLHALPTSQPPGTETNQTNLVSMPKCRSRPWSAQVLQLGPAQLQNLAAPKASAQSVLDRDRRNAGAQQCKANPPSGGSALHQINNSSRFPKSLTVFGYFAMKPPGWVNGTGTRFANAQGDSRLQHALGLADETKIPPWDPPLKPRRFQLQCPVRAGGSGGMGSWGAEAAASASPGSRAAPAPRCWVQTTRDPASANYVFIPTQRTNLLFPKSHITRGYTEIKWSFPIAALRAQDQARNLVHKHGQVKHRLKPQNLPLASPSPSPPLLL